jgi:hypothetical protein
LFDIIIFQKFVSGSNLSFPNTWMPFSLAQYISNDPPPKNGEYKVVMSVGINSSNMCTARVLPPGYFKGEIDRIYNYGFFVFASESLTDTKNIRDENTVMVGQSIKDPSHTKV